MKIALLADIHANLEAFRAVLDDIDQSDVSQVMSLGDNIGYGPSPNEVVSLLRDRRIPSIMGNHELVLANPRYIDWFNSGARVSVEKSLEMITADTRQYCSHLPRSTAIKTAQLVHGFPPASPTLYLFQIKPHRLKRYFVNHARSLCFVGHTHFLEAVAYDGMAISKTPLSEGVFPLRTNHAYIINIGSVGQPRDGNPCAKYVVWDSVKHQLQVKFIAYDIESVVAKILRLGLPRQNAERLR